MCCILHAFCFVGCSKNYLVHPHICTSRTLATPQPLQSSTVLHFSVNATQEGRGPEDYGTVKGAAPVINAVTKGYTYRAWH